MLSSSFAGAGLKSKRSLYQLANYVGVLLSLNAPISDLLTKYTRSHMQRALREIEAYKLTTSNNYLAFADERNSFRTFHQVNNIVGFVLLLTVTRHPGVPIRFA